MFRFITIITLALLCGCRDSGGKPTSEKLKKPASSFTDTLVIDIPAAVFYSPDSVQLQKIGAVNEKMVFASMQHDCYYQQRNARLVLEKYWPQLKIVESSRARYFKFVKADKSSVIIDLDEKGDMCGMFLFDAKKDPVLIDMMNVDTELGRYFAP